MRLDKVDLNLFVIFDAIYRDRSVTRVAQRLSLTQPGVSNALSRLRQTFDDPLFVRTPTGMMPTPVADSVVTDVRKALVLLGKSVGAAARFDPQLAEKQFCIGMNDLAQMLLLPPLRDLFRQSAPNCSLHIYYADRNSAAEDLKSGKVDLLLDSPKLLNTRELEKEALAKLPYVIGAGRRHHGKLKSMTLDSYLSSDHLHVSSRRKGLGQVDVALQALGEKRVIKMQVQSYLVAASVAQQTDLIWTVPEVLAQTTGLKLFELPFNVEPLEWALFWHKSATDDPANLWFRKCVEAVVRKSIN